MSHLLKSRAVWQPIGIIITGTLCVSYLKSVPMQQWWGKAVVQMPILSALIFPCLLYLFILMYKFELFSLSETPDHRVLLVRSDTILNEGLYRLLNRQSHLVLSTITTESETALEAEVESFAPDTVVITDQTPDTLFVHLLDRLPHYPSLQLVRVGLENDLVQIYQKNQISIQQLDDFATVIHGKAKQKKQPSMLSRTF